MLFIFYKYEPHYQLTCTALGIEKIRNKWVDIIVTIESNQKHFNFDT